MYRYTHRENGKEINNMIRNRLTYFLIFIALVIVEVLIAIYVHDSFVRPYLGDVIVIGVIYCFIKILIPKRVLLISLYIFIFALSIEVFQYFDYVNLLGLGEIKFFRILLGTSFSFIDIICYAVGAVICFIAEVIFNKATLSEM